MNGFTILISWPIVYPSGKSGPLFELTATADKDTVTVQEREVPERHRLLPTACPERHINNNGTFCLFWKDHEAITVIDEQTADLWWRNLFNFLRAQIYASESGQWPEGAGRAHGEAAIHEWRAEQIAEQFSQEMFRAFRSRKLCLRRMPVGGLRRRSLRLELKGRRIFAMWEGGTKIVNLGAACPCDRSQGRGRSIRDCLNHANLAADLIRQLAAMEKAEEDFFTALRFAGQKCCGSMKHCQLRKTNENMSPLTGVGP